MHNNPAMTSDRNLDELLAALSDAIDVPPMADNVSRARQRIEARASTGRSQESASTPFSPRDDRAAAFQPKEILQLPLDEQQSKIREFALLAAGLAAAAILAVGLTFVFGGFGRDDDRIVDYWPAGEFDDHPLAAEPFDLPGYEFERAIGAPQVPNTPTDVVTTPDGGYYVVDVGIGRVVALNPDGSVNESWGDEGFSPPFRGITGAALGPDNRLYVVANELIELNSDGSIANETQLPISDDLIPSSVVTGRHTGPAVDQAGNIYVGHSGADVIWRLTPDGQWLSIELGEDGLVGPVSDANGNIFAMTYAGRILQVLPNGQLETVTRLEDLGDVIDLAVDTNGFSVLIGDLELLDEMIVAHVNRQGGEIRVWNTGILVASSLREEISSITITPDGDVVVADPTNGHLQRFSVAGEPIDTLGEDGRGQFHYLWRIALDGNGNIYALDPVGEASIHVFDPAGNSIQEFDVVQDDDPTFEHGIRPMATANPFFAGHRLAVTPNGTVITGDYLGSTVRIYDDGTMVETWGEFGLGDDGPLAPLAVEAVNNNTLYISDDNGTIKEYTLNGELVRVLGELASDRRDLWYHDDTLWAVDGTSVLRYPLDGSDREIVASSTFAESDPGEIPGQLLSLAVAPDGNILVYSVDIIPMDELQIGQEPFVPALSMVASDGSVLWTRSLDPSPARYLDLAISDDGTIYISDSESRQILVYRPSDGDAAAPEPTATNTSSGDAVDLLLPVTEPPQLESFEFTGYIGESMIPSEPSDAVGTSDGRTFVSDSALDRIIAFTSDKQVDTGWGLGGVSARIPEPVRLALDPDGNLMASTVGGEVYRFDDPTEPTLVWSLPEGGQIWGFVIDSSGNPYLANAATGELITFADDGAPRVIGTIPRDTTDMTIDADDRIYVVSGMERVLIYDTSGALVDRWGTEDHPIAELVQARGVVFVPDLGIAFAQRNDDPDIGLEIVVTDTSGQVIGDWQTDIDDSYLSNVQIPSLGVDANGKLLVPDILQSRVARYVPIGDGDGWLTADSEGRVSRIASLTTGPNGDLYVLDDLARRAQRFSPNGELLATYDFSDLGRASILSDFHDMTVDGTGRVYLTVYWNQQIAVFAPNGERLTTFGNPGEARFDDETSLFGPYAIGMAGDGTLLVADEQSAGYIKHFTEDGEYLGKWLATEPNSLYTRFEVARGEVFVVGDDGDFNVFDPEGNHLRTVPYTRDVFSFDVDAIGNIYITGLTPSDERQSDDLTFELAIVDPEGNITELIDLGPSTQVPRVTVSADGKHLYVSYGTSGNVLAFEATSS